MLALGPGLAACCCCLSLYVCYIYIYKYITLLLHEAEVAELAWNDHARSRMAAVAATPDVPVPAPAPAPAPPPAQGQVLVLPVQESESAVSPFGSGDRDTPMTAEKYSAEIAAWRDQMKATNEPASFKAHSSLFNRHISDYSRGRNDVPHRVVHHRTCVGLCERVVAKSTWSCFLQLNRTLQEKAGSSEPLSACFAFKTSSSPTWHYAIVYKKIPRGTSNIWLQSLSWVVLEPENAAARGPAVGLTLKFKMLEFVLPSGPCIDSSSKRYAATEGQFGRLDILISKSLIARVFNRDEIMNVRVLQCAFTWVGLTRLHICHLEHDETIKPRAKNVSTVAAAARQPQQHDDDDEEVTRSG
jgi:hypothetical protein